MSARQAQEPISTSQAEEGLRKKYEDGLHRISQVTTNSPLEEGKVIRVGKHRRRKSFAETRDSWKETAIITRVANWQFSLPNWVIFGSIVSVWQWKIVNWQNIIKGLKFGSFK